MNRLSNELLLNTFKALDDNREIVKARLCCRAWSEVINENQQLWRKIDLLDIHNRWELVVLDLFDRRSQSTLVEVNLRSSLLSASKVSHLIQVLSRSKETLKTLHLWNSPPSMPRIFAAKNVSTWGKEVAEYHRLKSELSGLSCRFSHLQDFRLMSDSPVGKVRASIIKINSGSRGHSGFQVLWITRCKDLLTSHLRLLDHLSSLSIKSHEHVEWSKTLASCSKRLKHLSIDVRPAPEGAPILQLPSLEVLELQGLWLQHDWIVRPLNCLVVLNGLAIPEVTPNALNLWTASLSGWQNLARGSPALKELRVVGRSTESARLGYAGTLMVDRKRNVEAGLEVDGIRMQPLRKLVISFDDLKPSELQELRELVDEVVDLATVPELVEVVI